MFSTNQASEIRNGKAVNLTTEKLLKYLALLIMNGTIGYQRLEPYWTIGTVIPLFPEICPGKDSILYEII